MLCFAGDEDFDNRIVRGLLRLLPTLDIVRMQDVGLLGKGDPEVLEWAWTRISGPGLEGLIPLILLADFAGACEDCHAIDLPRVAGTKAEAGECTGR